MSISWDVQRTDKEPDSCIPISDENRIAAKAQACLRRTRMAVHRALAAPDVKKKYDYYRRDTQAPDPRD